MIIKNALLCSLLVFVCFSDIGLTQELCPSTQEIKKQLDLRRGTLETLNQQLNSLLNGELVKEVLPSALFAVDINDAMRVEKRIKEITSDLTKGIEEHPLFSCVKKSQELSNILQQIFEVEKKTNELRLQFLSLTSERRQALLNLQEQAMLYLKNVKKLELEKTEAQERSRNADQALKIAEQSIQSDVDSAIREVAAQRIILEKTRKEMADLNILWAEKLKVLADRFKRHSLNLSESASILSRQNATTQELFNAYTSTTIVWRSLLEDLFNNYESFAVEIPSLPRQPKDVI